MSKLKADKKPGNPQQESAKNFVPPGSLPEARVVDGNALTELGERDRLSGVRLSYNSFVEHGVSFSRSNIPLCIELQHHLRDYGDTPAKRWQSVRLEADKVRDEAMAVLRAESSA